jgi:hypothetical protein
MQHRPTRPKEKGDNITGLKEDARVGTTSGEAARGGLGQRVVSCTVLLAARRVEAASREMRRAPATVLRRAFDSVVVTKVRSRRGARDLISDRLSDERPHKRKGAEVVSLSPSLAGR